MPYTFRLLILLRREMIQLKRLEDLESQIQVTHPAEKPPITHSIEMIMEEIGESNRLIRNLKASYLLGLAA